MPKKPVDTTKTLDIATFDQTNTADKEEVDTTLDMVMDRFDAARSYTRRGFWDTWKNARKLYNSQRIMVNYEGNSDTFVPETFTILQNIKAQIIGGKISVDYYPTSKEQTGDTKVLKSLMDQIWIQDKTKLKASWAIDDSLQVGNGYLWQYWNGEFPTNKYVPTEDNFFDPDATSYENLKFGGYRYLTTVAELKEATIANVSYDPTVKGSEKRVQRFKNLDKLDSYKEEEDSKGNFENDKMAKQLREEMIAGAILSNGNDDDKIVEVIVYHDKKKLVRIANRCTVIEEVDTPFKREKKSVQSVDDQGNPVTFELPEIKPFIPVAPFRDITDGAMWYAKGEIEVIGDIQELINDTQNQKTDNLNYSLNRMWTLDPSQAHKIDQIQSVPGAVFTVPPGSLQPVSQQNIGPEADNEIMRLQSLMRRATASEELFGGSYTHTTAALVNAQMQQSGSKFDVKLEHYEAEGFTILANNMLKIMQIFLTQEQAVRLIGQEGIEWKNYNPGEYLGDYDVKVQLDYNYQKYRETEKQNAMQFFLLASKLPFVNQESLFKITATTLFDKDADEINSLINQQPPMVPGMQPGLPMGAPQPGGMDQMTQQGQGAMASMPQSSAENAVNASMQQAQGINIPGMPS